MPHHHSPANHEQDTVSVVQVERAIKGVRYPVSKTELVEYARGRNVGEDVIGRIEMLPGDRYASEADVATAFSRSQTAHTNPRTV